MPQCRGMPGQGGGSGWVDGGTCSEVGEGRWDKGFLKGSPRKGKTVEM